MSENSELFSALLSGGDIFHGCLIEGGDSLFRGEFVKNLACAIVCESPRDGLPCGACRDCIKAGGGIHPDIITLSPEEGKKSISIDSVRKLTEGLYIIPNEAERKVYIVKEAEKLTVQAQNALLKSLEEPPAYCHIILECEKEGGLLPTVRSRCRIVTLKQEKDTDDISLLSEGKEDIIKMILSLTLRDKPDFFGYEALFEKDREVAKERLKSLTFIMQAVLRAHMSDKLEKSLQGDLRKIFEKSSPVQISKSLDALLSAFDRLSKNAGQKLVIHIMFLECWEAFS